MKGLKKIFNWSLEFLPIFISIIILTVLLQWLYSYLPLLVKYSFAILGYGTKNVNLPKFMTNWFDSGSTVLNEILLIAVGMIILQAIRSVLRFLCNYSQKLLRAKMEFKLKTKLYKHVIDLPYSYHNNHDLGDLIQRSTSDVDQVSDLISTQIISLISVIATVTIGAVQVALININLLWVSIIIVPIEAISSVIYYKYCSKEFDLIDKAESKMTTTIQENINASRVVRAFANEKYEFEKMDKFSKKYRDEDVKFNTVMSIYWAISDTVVYIQFAVTMLVGINLAKKGSVGIDDITAVILLMNMLVFPMRGLGRIISSFGKANVAATRISEVLETPVEYVTNGEEKPKITGNIEFKNISFKFKDDDRDLLNDVSFKIKRGQTVAIVGKTGSGKSTICNLLVRFLEIDSGDILLDDTSISKIDKHYLRNNVRYVIQEPFLFSKTIYENIAISKENIKKNEVETAAQMAAIHDEVLKFKKGYNTVVGEKGTTLSGGQKQRVAIARMLVDESPIIIFDDSLSALDTKTDVLIRKALKLKSNEQTMIIITHRITTAKEADLILVLDNGVIEEAGTHQELANKGGLYSKLWQIQGELEKEFIDVLEKGDN